MRYVNDCFTAVEQVERALFDSGTINLDHTLIIRYGPFTFVLQVAALGATIEFNLRRQASRHYSETDGLQPFASRRCNKEIKGLIHKSNGVDDTATLRPLTACVIFSCFENMNASGDSKDAVCLTT